MPPEALVDLRILLDAGGIAARSDYALPPLARDGSLRVPSIAGDLSGAR